MQTNIDLVVVGYKYEYVKQTVVVGVGYTQYKSVNNRRCIGCYTLVIKQGIFGPVQNHDVFSCVKQWHKSGRLTYYRLLWQRKHRAHEKVAETHKTVGTTKSLENEANTLNTLANTIHAYNEHTKKVSRPSCEVFSQQLEDTKKHRTHPSIKKVGHQQVPPKNELNTHRPFKSSSDPFFKHLRDNNCREPID